MATYRQIQDHVREQHDFLPKTCWIADVMGNYGLTKRMAPNRHNPREREHPCPPGKREAIVRALKHFHMI